MITMRHTRSLRPAVASALAVVAVFAVACPNDPTESDDLSWITADGGVGSATQLKLDATSDTAWTYVSFANGVVETPANPEDSLAWDIAFQRYNVKTNGGTSGTGQGASADLGVLDLKDTATATVTGWTEDAVIEDARTDDERSMNAILSGWYAYHFFKHELVSLYSLYAVRSAAGRVALLKIHDYYDEAGTAGHYTLIYRFPVDAEQVDGGATDAGTDAGLEPLLDDVITEANGVTRGETNFDARAGLTFLSFADHGAVTVTGDPKASTAWDLSFDKWLLRTNSGTSGGAQGGALSAATTDFEAALTAPEAGYMVDEIATIGGEQRLESTNLQLAGWFDYDPTNQRIRSFRDVVFVRTAAGKYAKIQFLGYYHPDGSEAFYRLKWALRADGGRAF